jgi:hypothetical protein
VDPVKAAVEPAPASLHSVASYPYPNPLLAASKPLPPDTDLLITI